MASTEADILFLSLSYQSFLDEQYSSLIDDLNKSARVKRAKSTNGALRYLSSNKPKAIIVTDEGLTERKNAFVLDTVLTYTRNGGLVIVGLHFPSFTNMDMFDGLWAKFGLPWKSGDYHRTDFQYNPSSTLPAVATADALPAPYSMKALHVKNARQNEKIFIPVPEAQTQSHVFPLAYVDQAQAAVVGATIGDGYLAYIGDVNGEGGSDKVVLALCGYADT